MDLSAPHTAVLPSSEGRALAVLAGTTRPLSGREVARIADASQASIWRALGRLVDQGVVLVVEAGSGAVSLYTFNRDHVAAEPLIALLRLRESLFDRIKDTVVTWPLAPVHVSVFGSAARGDGDAKSDIDLFVVRPHGVDEEGEAWRSQLNVLAEFVHSWSGNHAGIADIPEDDLRRLKRERPPIVEALENEAIVLFGLSVKEMFGRRG